MSGRYQRQTLLPFFGGDGQAKLLKSRVSVIGCGALGSGIANNLARAGVGHLRLCDRDVVELNNLHRQMLFDEADVAERMPKAVAAARRLRAINSDIVVEPVVADINFTNVDAWVADVDLVIDGTDNFETRYLLNDICVKLGKPWIYGGCVSTYGLVMPVRPGETACLRCIFPEPPPAGSAPTCDTAGVLNASALTVASVQSAEAMKILSGNTDACINGMLELDLWANSYRQLALPRDPDCVCCGQGRFTFLDGQEGAFLTSLCGRNAVQIVQRQPHPVDLARMRAVFDTLGSVTANKFLLKVSIGSHDITLFADGRALIGGTTDVSVARSLYAKYVGA